MSFNPKAFEINPSGHVLANKFFLADASANIEFQDNSKAIFGTGADASIYFDASSLLIASENIPVTIGNSSSTVTIAGNLSVAGTTTTVDTVTMQAANAVVFEGATADDFETTLTIVDPAGADKTIYLPNANGYLPVLAVVSTTAITSTPEELNILDGVTSTAAELNILDGVTSTAAELNILDGVTATATELNYLDITTLGTAENSKAFTRKGDGTATFAGTTIADLGTVTTADINGGTLDGVTVGGASAAAGTFTTLDCTDGAFALANLDIDGATDIGEAIVDADLFIIDNGAGGTNRKCAASRLKTYITGGLSIDSSFSGGEVMASDVNLVTGGGGGLTVDLPSAGASSAGTVVYVKKTDAAAGAVTIATEGSETIDGASTKLLYAQGEAMTFISDGSNWHIF